MSTSTRRKPGLKLRRWERVCAIGSWARTRQSHEPPRATIYQRRAPPISLQLGSRRTDHSLRRSLKRSLLALAAVTLTLCGCFKKNPPPRLTEVTVGTPIRQDVPVYSQWIGTTVGFIDAEIHSKVTGYLMAQNYQEGSLVKTGDLLFEVDPRPFQAVVDQANAQLNVANAGLTQAKADVDAAKAEIDRAEAAQLKTELDVKRYAPLAKDGTVSQQELDDAVQSNLANLASIAAAKGKFDHSKATVTAAEAQIGVARSSLQAAE